MTTQPHIVLFALRELHFPVLLPVYRELAALGLADVGFCAPRYTVTEDGQFQEGLSDATLQRLAAEGIPFWGERPRGRVSCVVTADSCYDRVDGWGPIVCVGHGTISKGFYFADVPFVRKENFATTICVPGSWYVSSYGDKVFTRVVPTGFSRMDELARLGPGDRKALLTSIGLSLDKTTILYAPTFNYELTSMLDLFTEWATIDTTRYQVIFKLHGAAFEKLKEYYRTLASKLPGFHYAENPDLAPYLNACDIVISDVSSAYVESFVLDKPVIVYNNPKMREYPAFNAKAVEFAVRDAAYQVNRPADLAAMLETVRTQDPLRSRRQEYARALFTQLDGKNSARIAEEIRLVATGEVVQPLPDGNRPLRVYIPPYARDIDRIAANLDRLLKPAEVVTLQEDLTSVGTHHVRRLETDDALELPFVVVTGETDLPYDWDFLYCMQRRYNPVPGILGPLLVDDPANGPQQHALVRGAWPYPQERCQSLYKYGLYDRVKRVESLRPDGLFVTAGVDPALVAKYVDGLDDVVVQREFAAEVLSRGGQVGVMEGVVAL